ncbi:hypothetical protein JX265_012935 [Neoarthrinium moseri]|uniref:Uncharacterized protein n=1 Tax=Neoarthrinium moseri TaxID=1658444 RepID=A0A9P9W9G9_9PEZI|nr:uncharacterized protein JN550_002846 [Neoarthrinium moseri]KAI1840780.1 hypothetical protein JX266_013054 [Neoarthrinium moseri]KAI1852907.1 hypothetical protein JX265_012935 [Neoarthrinium moseri]KAI1874267.1 hypothetical protein JN550_002846 [Neoarthrinium moseri]
MSGNLTESSNPPLGEGTGTAAPVPDTASTARAATAADPAIRGSADINMAPDLPKEKVQLQGVEQTLLPMVLFKARDTLSPNPILGDQWAKPLLDQCDIDMDASHFKFTTDPRYVTWIANRSKRLDQWTQEFLDSHEEPVTVLHLACGLDCRYFRVNKPSNVRWIELDQPLVVDLRKRLIMQPPGDYTLRTLSVTDDGWFRDIPADRPTIIVAEGLVMYLEQEKGEKLIRDLVDYFKGPNGQGQCQLVFDTLGTLSVRLTSYIKALRTSKSVFKWGIDEPQQIERLHPQLKMRDRILWREFMDSHPPFFGKYGTLAASVMPSFEKNIQFWRFEF